MKLDRNLSPQNIGKYALIKLRDLPPGQPATSGPGNESLSLNASAVDFGDTPAREFFVVRLRDKYAWPALKAYADACRKEDPEYSAEILALAHKAKKHPLKHRPD